jgi:quinol monooxygenase YgiN/quercetin dioxygenase-like cupin family protein
MSHSSKTRPPLPATVIGVTPVGRYSKAKAKSGQGDALAQKLLEVAEGVQDAAGAQLYVVNRSTEDPDVVWVTELWQSQKHLDEALESEGARAEIPNVLALIEPEGGERVELQPLGGAGYLAGVSGSAIVNLDEVEDSAAKFGLGETGESRFARGDLGSLGTAVSLHRLRPGVRQSFGHSHHADEEIYVVLAGSGRVAIDEEIHEIGRLDAIRVSPASTRAFEAGPDGLEFLAMGMHHPGDAQIVPGFWPGE